MALLSFLCSKIFCLLLPADGRKIEFAAHTALQTLPDSIFIRVGPSERANPRLDIPPQFQLDIRTVLQLPTDICDSILRVVVW